MHKTLLYGLSASLLMALNVSAAGPTTPASTMAWELNDAAGKCQSISINNHLQDLTDDTTISNAGQSGHAGDSQSNSMGEIAQASLGRKLSDGKYDACLVEARKTGAAAFQKYQAVPDQPQAIRNDAKDVYTTWFAALPDITKNSAKETPQVSAYRKALIALRKNDVAK